MNLKVLTSTTADGCGDYVDGNFYHYRLSLSEIQLCRVYLKLVDESYKIDAAHVFAHMLTTPNNSSIIRWNMDKGVGLMDFAETYNKQGRPTDMQITVPYGVQVVTELGIPFPWQLNKARLTRYSAMINSYKHYYHCITPVDFHRGAIRFKLDGAYDSVSSFEDIVPLNTGKVDRVDVFFKEVDSEDNLVYLTNQARIGDYIWLPTAADADKYSSGQIPNFGIPDFYEHDVIKNYAKEAYGDLVREDLRRLFAVYSGPYDLNTKPIFSKRKNTLKVSAEEAAKAMNEFANTIKLQKETDAIMAHGTSQDWIKYCGTDPNTARDNLRDIVWKMLRNGHSVESVTASISLTSLFFQKEYRAKCDKVRKEVAAAAKEDWFITYLRTQPKSRFQVVEDIVIRIVDKGEDIEKILGDMREVAAEKELNDKINHYMEYTWVKLNIALGINTPAYIRSELTKMYPHESKITKFFTKLINENDERERENAIKAQDFIKRANVIGIENASKEAYLINDIETLSQVASIYQETDSEDAAILIANLSHKLGLTVGSVNHKVHNLMSQGMSFKAALNRLEQVVTINSLHGMKPMVSPLKVIEIGAHIKVIADAEHKTIKEVQDMACELAEINQISVGEVLDRYIKENHLKGTEVSVPDAFFRGLSMDEHERAHGYSRPVRKAKGYHTGSEDVTGNEQSVPNSSERGEQGTDRPSEESAIRPQHYGKAGIQPIDFVRAHGLSFDIGNVIKYVTRAGKKYPEKHVEDLEKAKYYLEHEIDFIKYPEKWEKRFAEMARLEEEERRKEDER